MIGNFNLVKKITLILPDYSSKPITFENVYCDRFNSIFKGFYLLLDADKIDSEKIEENPQITFVKIPSSERFGLGLKSSDILDVDIVKPIELTAEQKQIINYLNRCIEAKNYTVKE
ncbi:MAG: hypothetical protein WDA35_01225 [Bacilli bacterium]